MTNQQSDESSMSRQGPWSRTELKFPGYTRRETYHHARLMEASLGRKPTAREYEIEARRGNVPSPRTILARTGLSTGDVNELMGYPNVRLWDREKFVAWGARVMDVNHGRQLTTKVLDIIALRERGPSHQPVNDEFGTLAEFQRQARERYETDPTSYRTRERAARERFEELVGQELINPWIAKYISKRSYSDFIAKYDIARENLRGMDELEYAYLAAAETEEFTNTILGQRRDLTLEDLELAAIAHDHTDDIWSLSDRWNKHLIVTDEDIRTFLSTRRGVGRRAILQQSSSLTLN